MKAYEIIKGIRYDGVKLTHLNTLSISVDEMDNTDTINHADSDDFMIIILLNRLSKIAVTLAHFVPCDKNGVPLEELPKVIHSKEQLSLKYKHVMSEDNVIFEGWEVVSKNIYGGITIRNLDLYTSLHFFGDRSEVNFRIKNPISKFEGANITLITLADLAAATTENPIKLK